MECVKSNWKKKQQQKNKTLNSTHYDFILIFIVVEFQYIW